VPSTNQWLAFVIASALFIQVPGPSLLFTIGRALTVGRRDALLSVVGNALGLIAQVVLVAVGLGAVVAASAHAYTALKLVGAAYVVWLGIQAIRHRADARVALDTGTGTGTGLDLSVARDSALRSLRIGFTVGLTNPKTIVFFVAFLPQFVNEPAGHTGIQLGLLGLVFGVMAACSDSVWALAAARARDWFARRPHRLDRLGVAGGVMMIGLGATLAATD
jgi:threonine/homoserine/homoserine lactone efflux protein